MVVRDHTGRHLCGASERLAVIKKGEEGGEVTWHVEIHNIH